MATTGQFYYVAQGNPTDARLAYIDINASTGSNTNSTTTVLFDNNPTVDLGTSFPQEVQVDWAAGIYYVISNGGVSGDNAHILMGHIGGGPPVEIWNAATIGGTIFNGVFGDVINTIQIDPFTHHLYIGYTIGDASDTNKEGILDYTYNTTTGAITPVATNGGYLVTQTQANIQSSVASGLDLFDARDFALDHTHQFLFFTQHTDGDGFESNEIYRIDLTNPTAAPVALVLQTAFPWDNDGGGNFAGNNGAIIDVEVDSSTGLVYFDTESVHPSPDPSYTATTNKIYYIDENASGGVAVAVTLSGLPGGNHFYPGNMQLDPATRQLYVASEETDTGGVTVDDVIYVFQLDASGHAATLINTIAISNPAFTTDAANIDGMAFDSLATIGTLSGTSTHAVEQVTNLDLLTAAPSIADLDGDHLNNATVKISGSFVGSGDDLYALDGATHRTSGTFGGTSITISRTTDGSGNQTLTLTGYDTFANYQTVINAVAFTANGDNPTNYGLNGTRTVTWQVNDGAIGNPSGTVDGTTTNARTTTVTIDAVNDAPVNNSLVALTGGNSVTEDTGKQITFSVSDVDADPATQNITVRLQVLNGIIDINTAVAGGLTAGQVTGDNTSDVLLTGTQNQINATLASATGAIYHNTPDYNGSDTLTVTSNDQGHTGTPGAMTDVDVVSININAVVDIANDSATTNEDIAVNVLVLGNDTFEGTPAITGTTNGAHGTVAVNDNGTPGNTADDFVVYTPNADYNGADSFTYTVTSGGVTETATVNVTINAVVDIANDSATTNEDIAVNVLVLANDTFEGTPAITGTTNGAHGTVAVNNNGTPGNTADDFVVYTPNADYNGADSFTYTVTSGGVAETATVNVTINAVQDIANDSAETVENTPVNVLVLANDTFEGTPAITGTTNGAHGTVLVNDNGTPGNTADDFITYTPAAAYNGPDSFTYTVTSGGLTETATVEVTISPPHANVPPVNTVPGTQDVEANTATAISGLSITDPDAASGTVTTTLSVAHGTLAVASAGGAAVTGSGTASVTLTGTIADINTTLAAANNVLYTGAHDFFGTDHLTVLTNDGGNTGTGGALTDSDSVLIFVNTLIIGTSGNDSYNALPGQERIDGDGGIDSITFNFKLVDASIHYEANKVIIDGPSGSHTVLTGFEVFNFTDGTVHNDDGSPLIDDLFYYAKYHDVWNAHVDADAHYNSVGWHEGRDPDAFFSTVVYLSANPDVKAAGVNPLSHFDTAGWIEGRVPSINFDPAQYLAANPDVAAAHVDPLRHFLQSGAGEGRLPFAPSELVTANGFDYVYYLNHNPDVAASGVDPFQHFETVGWQEGRNPNALFDVNGYLANYADVAAAHVNPLDHYNQFGWHEGRDPSPGFDTTDYLAAYADVNAAHVNPLTHFLHFGIHEGRSPFADGVWG